MKGGRTDMSKIFYSKKEFDRVDKKYRAILLILREIASDMENIVREDKRKKPKAISSGVSYNFIPNSRIDSILNNLIKAYKIIRKRSGSYVRFLDAGCGIGNIVVLAKKLGLDAFGIDIDNSALSRGRKLYQSLRFDDELSNRNIMTYTGYKSFDIIYYYCPFRDGKLQRAFEQVINNNVKEGAIIIAYSMKSDIDALKKDKRFEMLCPDKNKYQDCTMYQRLPNVALPKPTNGEATEEIKKELAI